MNADRYMNGVRTTRQHAFLKATQRFSRCFDNVTKAKMKFMERIQRAFSMYTSLQRFTFPALCGPLWG
jgi:hypothetical protein